MSNRDPGGLLSLPRRNVARFESGQLSLPGWDPPQRTLPSQIAKSAVFTARRDRDSGELARQVIPSRGSAVVEYEGPLLNQSHADAWECLVHACKSAGCGSLRFTAKAILRLMVVGERRIRYAEEGERLDRLMSDLARATVRVRYPDASEFAGSLISYHRSANGSYDLRIDDDIVHLFWDSHVVIDWKMRVAIKGELAKWLQHYFAASLDPTLIAEIRLLSSSQTRDLYRFRQAVKIALAELVRVGALTAGEVRGNYALASIDPEGKLPRLPVIDSRA
jgi:hypothetical protein